MSENDFAGSPTQPEDSGRKRKFEGDDYEGSKKRFEGPTQEMYDETYDEVPMDADNEDGFEVDEEAHEAHGQKEALRKATYKLWRSGAWGRGNFMHAKYNLMGEFHWRRYCEDLNVEGFPTDNETITDAIVYYLENGMIHPFRAINAALTHTKFTVSKPMMNMYVGFYRSPDNWQDCFDTRFKQFLPEELNTSLFACFVEKRKNAWWGWEDGEDIPEGYYRGKGPVVQALATVGALLEPDLFGAYWNSQNKLRRVAKK